MDKIKQLEEKFTGRGEVRGFQFAQICKTDRAFCYEVRTNGIITHYEVFNRKINNRFGCESYPTANAFGIWAWTYTCLGKALKKMKSI
jgi:hypothetical protein